jgi:hypothetical protein
VAENHLPSFHSQNLILAIDFFEKTPYSGQEEYLTDFFFLNLVIDQSQQHQFPFWKECEM